jgi:hypothetical protein
MARTAEKKTSYPYLLSQEKPNVPLLIKNRLKKLIEVGNGYLIWFNHSYLTSGLTSGILDVRAKVSQRFKNFLPVER